MKTYQPPNVEEQTKLAAAWNRAHPVGTLVSVTMDDDSQLQTTTQSEASVLPSGLAVIWVRGISGCYKLDRVAPVEPDVIQTITIKEAVEFRSVLTAALAGEQGWRQRARKALGVEQQIKCLRLKCQITFPSGGKRKRFCSDTCRELYDPQIDPEKT